MKTYVLKVSKTFPSYHKRKGEDTLFVEQISCALFCPGTCDTCNFHKEKIHTIRENYSLWDKRIKEIQNGNAILSIRYWSGEPYNSKQVEIHKLDKDSGIGIQQIEFIKGLQPIINGVEIMGVLTDIAENDGLSFDDFKEWFKNYELCTPMAIIHFTNFRY